MSQITQCGAIALEGRRGGGAGIVLPGTIDSDAFEAQINDLQAKLNDGEVLRADLTLKKQALLTRLVQFNEKIRAFFPDSKWLGALPRVPGIGEGQGRFMEPVEDIRSLWLKINADPGTASPVTLLGGYSAALFQTDFETQKSRYAELADAEISITIARNERNAIQGTIYSILKSHRQVLPTFFAAGDAIVESLPRLTPLPGSTPEAVIATAQWQPASQDAQVSWSESDNPDLDSYEVRMSPGPDYSTDDEVVVGSVPASAPRVLNTAAGLSAPGVTAGFKVYVITNTGNERGSNPVHVERPPVI